MSQQGILHDHQDQYHHSTRLRSFNELLQITSAYGEREGKKAYQGSANRLARSRPEEHELLELLSLLVERCRTKADILAPVCAQRARRDLVPKICGLDCLAAAGGSA